MVTHHAVKTCGGMHAEFYVFLPIHYKQVFVSFKLRSLYLREKILRMNSTLKGQNKACLHKMPKTKLTALTRNRIPVAQHVASHTWAPQLKLQDDHCNQSNRDLRMWGALPPFRQMVSKGTIEG